MSARQKIWSALTDPRAGLSETGAALFLGALPALIAAFLAALALLLAIGPGR